MVAMRITTDEKVDLMVEAFRDSARLQFLYKQIDKDKERIKKRRKEIRDILKRYGRS